MNTIEDQKADKLIFKVGGVATILVLAGVLLDMAVGIITGGDITLLPQTAVEKYGQISQNWIMGLYTMDFLNEINQLIFIPGYFALYVAHKNTAAKSESMLALILFLVGSTILVTGNTSLTLIDLSHKYASATSESDKMLYAAAGEAMLAKGSHGSLGVLVGFILPNIAGIIMSLAMIKGKVFGKKISYCGFIGSILMVVYLLLVTLAPGVDKMATAFALPGGILLMIWMISFTVGLFRLGNN